MAVVPSFDDASLHALCDILGATDTGLAGSEIGQHLFKCRFLDPEPTITKRHRLFAALSLQQKTDANANGVPVASSCPRTRRDSIRWCCT
jgi:hypothetical protein